jgi:4-carboxymuconolactone decarboxylase
MARIHQVESPKELSGEQKVAWAEIAKSRGVVRGPFSVLLHSPDLARRTAHLGSFIRFEASAPAPARAIACLTTARFFDCQYEWSGNVDDAQEAGVGDVAIGAIRDRRAPEGLEGDERLVFELTTQLLSAHRISERTFNDALGRFGVSQLVELVASIGYYCNIAMTLNAFEVDTLPHFPRLLPVERVE